ncbi:hypothetical protein MARCHEWKA_01090 [Brevundimonas phage vB_BpoS-Marchewka]|uniref:Uncharacterized protein n=1 Tax=Brevundimonas phage vB_BpoS-Marchewka TaxID=2948604 RepID=A0A9E7N4Z1_9CAUD|nr:hypothetical protein MARCHEWKA_01090 [Brevundimonas phage vB_BpoS-Marchewka]
MFLTATELHALAPFGATIRFTDGTAKPPARFNKKLAEWKRHNGLGLFVEKKDADSYQARFSLRTDDESHFKIDKSFGVAENPALRFEVVRLPAPYVVLEDVSSIAPGWVKLKSGTAETLTEAEALMQRHWDASKTYPLSLRPVTHALRAALTETPAA